MLMLTFVSALSTALLIVLPAIRCAEVCCQGGICYNDNPPFNGLPLPTCGEAIQISMRLYTRTNPTNGQVVTRTTIPPAFQGSKLTIFYVHGWLGSRNNNWLHEMKDASLQQGDYNVVVVGWEGSSQQIWYPQSASDTRSVGTEIGLVAQNFVDRAGSAQARLYCVGHSLGSHVCGHAGARRKFGRITGLDPAGPLFENRDWACGLNPSCADLVDVLHTNGVPGLVLNLGTMKQLGHVDFYPNGGGTQPECILDPLLHDDDQLLELLVQESDAMKVDLMPACSHFRAVRYFQESILTPCFNSRHKCTSTANMPGSCTVSGTPIQTMGFAANTYAERGIFYLETTGKDPYCVG